MPTFQEFFAGGGMARAGLGSGWDCVFANDFDPMKSSVYRENWRGAHFHEGDVAQVTPDMLPTADLAWASFPCQDLSLAGDYRGLGGANARRRTRSGTFWAFWNLMCSLSKEARAPRVIVLENVYGTLRSNQGRDFSAILTALTSAGYRVGALVIDAKLFVPQSRPRLFFVALREDAALPDRLTSRLPNPLWHPASLVSAVEDASKHVRASWVWWSLPTPEGTRATFTDIVDDEPVGVPWHSSSETRHILDLMSPLNKAKVSAAKQLKRKVVGAVYRRTRPDENGKKTQRAEVRFDDIAGCLRTPAGGSSRQTILVIDESGVRSRLLSAHEAAKLMGLDPTVYRLPPRYNDAYHVAGDGVVVPVVRHLAASLLEPLLLHNVAPLREAAE